MKTTKILFVALVMGLFTATTVQAQDHNHKESDMKSEQMGKEMYVCTMHADEKSENPGKCSQCKMNLKKMNMKSGDMMHKKMKNHDMKDGNKSEVKMESRSSDMASSYICPMKCEGEKTYEKAESCPKCGMDLKQKGKKKEGDHKGHKH